MGVVWCAHRSLQNGCGKVPTECITITTSLLIELFRMHALRRDMVQSFVSTHLQGNTINGVTRRCLWCCLPLSPLIRPHRRVCHCQWTVSIFIGSLLRCQYNSPDILTHIYLPVAIKCDLNEGLSLAGNCTLGAEEAATATVLLVRLEEQPKIAFVAHSRTVEAPKPPTPLRKH
uniref:Uncharacterized protein n=1 Tax=Eutreptiella gymnastica TaxID=73025 RepID=A0A7S4FZ63_9EUGL